jgi:hypothetical protein
MRIQSSFKDYYDYIQRYVFGESSTFHRHWCDTVRKYESYSTYDENSFFVGFCGTIYNGIVTYAEEYDEKNKRHFCTPEYHFDIDSYEKSRRRIGRLTREERRTKLPFFDHKKDDEIFISENSPIILANLGRNMYGFSVCCPLTLKRHRNVQKIPSLEKIGFDKIVSDKEAYTQLTGYIEGFLSVEHKSVPDMSDKIKRDSHGFSDMSFKNRSVN